MAQTASTGKVISSEFISPQQINEETEKPVSISENVKLLRQQAVLEAREKARISAEARKAGKEGRQSKTQESIAIANDLENARKDEKLALNEEERRVMEQNFQNEKTKIEIAKSDDEENRIAEKDLIDLQSNLSEAARDEYAKEIYSEEIARLSEQMRAAAERQIRKEIETRIANEKREEELLSRQVKTIDYRSQQMEGKMERRQIQIDEFKKSKEISAERAAIEKSNKINDKFSAKIAADSAALIHKEKVSIEKLKESENVKLQKEQITEKNGEFRQAYLKDKKEWRENEIEAHQLSKEISKIKAEEEKEERLEKKISEQEERQLNILLANMRLEREKRERLDNEARLKEESKMRAQLAKEKLTLEEEKKRLDKEAANYRTSKRAEDLKERNRFEQEIKQMASSNALMEKENIYKIEKAKIEKEYEMLQEEEIRRMEEMMFMKFEALSPDKFQEGITEDIFTDANKTTVQVAVKKQSTLTIYRKVSWAWGGIYYFKGNESISGAVFDIETRAK